MRIRDLKHRRRNKMATLWACVRLSKRRPVFVDDEIQGGLQSSLKRKYKTILFACKSLFSPPCHSVQVEIYSLWISRIQMLSTLSISSPANLNLFFRFGLFENLSDGGTTSRKRPVSFPLPVCEPVRLDAVRFPTVYVYSCILGCTTG